MAVAAEEIIAFWREAGPRKWFAKDEAFDATIAARFASVHHEAARGEHDAWIETPDGALALVLLFDQFPRHIFRGSAHAFATDPLARSRARAALDAGHDLAVDPGLTSFFYMPFMHAEDLADQDLGVELFERLEREGQGSARWARDHRGIIARFGRFPHRNARLGRATTAEEHAFLDGGGFAG
ncbi:MAG TPA: DUF924 family protein [Caulobacteraceae bacterium]